MGRRENATSPLPDSDRVCTYMGVLSSAWCPGGRTTAKPFYVRHQKGDMGTKDWFQVSEKRQSVREDTVSSCLVGAQT